MKNPPPATVSADVEPAPVLVEIIRNFHIDEPTCVPDRSTRKSFLAGDRHVVDQTTADLWTAQGHAGIVDAE